MGEMLFLEPVAGSFAVYAHRYMSPFFGYLTAWSYWFMWMAVGISEITAIGVYVQFWFPEMAQWIPALIAVGLVALANLAAVRLYGEIEFWFAMIKVTTIIVMIVVGLGVIFFGLGNGGQPIGFGNLTEHGGFFAGGWKGFLTALCIVVASYQGVELIGITSGEAKNPQVTLRSAVGKVLWRILIFYVGALIAIMAIVPWRNFHENSDGSFGSPFIMVFKYAGLDWAAALVFFVVITAAASALNSLIYSAGRHLYQLASDSESPAMARLAEVSDHKVPAKAIVASGCMILFSPIINAIPGISGAFVLFASAASAVVIFIYVLTMLAHHRYRQSSDFLPDGFVMPAWQVFDWIAITFFVLVYVTLFLSTDTIGSAIAGLIWLVAFGGYCLLHERFQNRDLKEALQQ